MVYEYANRFAERGERVFILYLNEELPARRFVPTFLMKLLVNRLSKKSPNWFTLSSKVVSLSALDEKDRALISGMDAVIATAADTAYPVSKLNTGAKKFYFIQDYETFAMPEPDLIRTYRLGLIPVTVSSWLKERVDLYSAAKAVAVSNPIDTHVYTIRRKPEDRKEYSLGLLYHTSERKGLEYSFQAIEKLKMLYPALSVKMFGTSELDDLPDFFEYTKNASREETVQIYNSISVFMCSSLWEGFGLTGLESMASGAALCTTDFEGSREYAVPGVNALVSDPGNVDAMVRNVAELFDNKEKRIALAYAGAESAKKHNWDTAVTRFLGVLKDGTVK